MFRSRLMLKALGMVEVVNCLIAMASISTTNNSAHQNPTPQYVKPIHAVGCEIRFIPMIPTSVQFCRFRNLSKPETRAQPNHVRHSIKIVADNATK